MAERWSISRLRDVLYIELGKAIRRGTLRGNVGCAGSGSSTSRATRWKIYKRAYKKYYARFMKGNMSREDFKAWGEGAAIRRDLATVLLRQANSEEERVKQIESLWEDLNRLRVLHCPEALGIFHKAEVAEVNLGGGQDKRPVQMFILAGLYVAGVFPWVASR